MHENDNDFQPYVKDIDPVAFLLNQVRTSLMWIEEHRASFEANRGTDPTEAERELVRLSHVTDDAKKECDQLIRMILAGKVIDRNKRIPSGLSSFT